MKGVVEVYRGEEKILEESNMLMDNLGSQIAFWMSLPRGFGEIPSASAIYDTSNYTVRAASLGKDAAGYNHHAHSPEVSSLIRSDGKFRVICSNPAATNYKTEEFATKLVTDRLVVTNPSDPNTSALVPLTRLDTRNEVLPEDSYPTMQRLESKSTAVSSANSVVRLKDYGHNLNETGNGFLARPAGCYAPPGNSEFILLNEDKQPIGSPFIINNETVRGFNSSFGASVTAVDSRGFIRVTVSGVGSGRIAELNGEYYRGLLLSREDNWRAAAGDLGVYHILELSKADFLCLNFFGGIYTMGLWGFDIETMIKNGRYPPYTQDVESIEYKLFARKTFNKDLTHYEGTLAQAVPLKINWKFLFK